MKNPIRRNRNIGTSKQGHGQNNLFEIPYPASSGKSFHERLGNYTVVERVINDHTFRFIIEKTRKTSFHACSVDDVATIITHIPKKDYGELTFIIFRQPKRKEEIHNPAWGRLVYYYEFEGEYFPAIILEAIDLTHKLIWKKKLSLEEQQEFARLNADGHAFVTGKKFHEANYELEAIRATQLYRTLPHEFGHYAHYLKIVGLEQDDEAFEDWEKRSHYYNKLPTSEKEQFAHRYADTLKKNFTEKGLIPFPKRISPHLLHQDGLEETDFFSC